MSSFDVLNAVNVSDKTEKKNGLTYLSWAWAWGEFKKHYPDSYYTVYENPQGYNYFTDGHTCWVKTGVTLVDGDKAIELIEYLPIMDFKNRSISANAVTSYDVNKSIQRSLTKAIARHGLGLYIYAGEDLPEDEQPTTKSENKPQGKKDKAKEFLPVKNETEPATEEIVPCSDCACVIESVKRRDGSPWTVKDMVAYSTGRFGRPLCAECMKKVQKAEAQKAKEALAADAEAHGA